MSIGIVINLQGEPLSWHQFFDAQGESIPWHQNNLPFSELWGPSENVLGFAFKQSGRGLPKTSEEDLEAFQAVERELGRRLDWWIVNENHVLRLHWIGGVYGPKFLPPSEQETWVSELREASGGPMRLSTTSPLQG